MPEVAIIILNYNGQHYLEECLTHLQRLTTPAQWVLADNGSTDGSVEYVRAQWPQVRVLAFGENLGFAECYNRAIAAVEAEWVVLLNNDANLAPDWLALLLAAVEQHPRAAALGGKFLLAGPHIQGRVLQSAGAAYTDAGTAFEIGWGEPDAGQYNHAKPTASIPGAALLMKRAVFLELGGFNADYFIYLEDVDVCWRAWLAGYEVWYIPQAEVWHRFGGSVGGRAAPFRIERMQRNRYANMVKHLETGTLLRGLFTSLIYDGYRVLEFTAGGQWDGLRALCVGTWAFAKSLPRLLQQRRAIQATRRVRDRELIAQGLLVSALVAFREYRRLRRLR